MSYIGGVNPNHKNTFKKKKLEVVDEPKVEVVVETKQPVEEVVVEEAEVPKESVGKRRSNRRDR